MRKISYLTSGHNSFDDRIFYKFGFSLVKNGFNYSIISSREEIAISKNEINILSFDGSNLKKEEKINNFIARLREVDPQIILCGEPLPVFAAERFKRKYSPSVKIIYDVTEWYPENVAFKFYGIKKWLKYFSLGIINFLATQKVEAVICGEPKKLKRYLLFNPKLRSEIISYFPPKYFYEGVKHNLDEKSFTLGFTGILDASRGFHRFLSIVKLISQNSSLKIKLLIVGSFIDDESKDKFENFKNENQQIDIDFHGYCEYEQLSQLLSKADIFLDLREDNFIFRNSLPIKIFEYLSLGKTVIYPNFQLLENEFGSATCVHLVDVNQSDSIAELIHNYIKDRMLLLHNSETARELIKTKFNWESEEEKLLRLLQSFLKN